MSIIQCTAEPPDFISNSDLMRMQYLPVNVAMMPPGLVHLPLGQIQGCHLEVMFGKYCKQSENKE